jgi:hypothetical protein
MPITKIISGAQTGADQGALDAAIYCDVPHGGWCPKGRKSEAGRIPDTYNLKETNSANYLVRTEANVIDSDATLILTLGIAKGGSLRTIEFAHGHGKPYLAISVTTMSRKRAVEQIVSWLNGAAVEEPKPPRDCVLNVAGNRESRADGIQDVTEAIIIDVIRAVNPDCKVYPLP